MAFSMRPFIFSTFDEIKSGKVTDIYFNRTVHILKSDGLDRVKVYAEFTLSGLPKKYKWIFFAGLRDVLKLLEGLPINVYALPEGTLVTEKDMTGVKIPVLALEGNYVDFAIYETPILGFLAAASGFLTKAARIRKVAGDDVIILNFGARRPHPAISPLCDYYSYIGGFDAISNIVGAEILGKKPTGTMPHALLIIYRFVKGDHSKGWEAFHKYMPADVPRILLVDTFSDEVEEAIKAVETVGPENVFGIRLDTPSSRRGNFAYIIREVKWKLAIRGYKHIKIVVSGGIDEDAIPELKEAGAEAFGIGSAIATAPFIDYAMDIVSLWDGEKWVPLAKRGKFDGRKQVWRKIDEDKILLRVLPENEKGPEGYEPLLVKWIENGKIIRELPDPEELRKYVKYQLDKIKIDKLPWEG